MTNLKQKEYKNLKVTGEEKSKLENSFVVLLMLFILNIAYIFYFLPQIDDLDQAHFETIIWIIAFVFTYKALCIFFTKQRASHPKLSSAGISLIMAGLIRGWIGIIFYIIFLSILWRIIKNPYYFRDKASKNIEKDKTIEKEDEKVNRFYCNQCGKKIEKDSNYCTNCGNKINNK